MNIANVIARMTTIHVTYGLGATISTAVPRHALVGCTVREAIEAVLKGPHAPGSPEERTAAIIVEALHSRRILDVEIGHGPSESTGQPVALDDVLDRVLSGEHRSESTEGTVMEEELYVGLSEPYRGGSRSAS